MNSNVYNFLHETALDVLDVLLGFHLCFLLGLSNNVFLELGQILIHLFHLCL